jgi:hypothetical protein
MQPDEREERGDQQPQPEPADSPSAQQGEAHQRRRETETDDRNTGSQTPATPDKGKVRAWWQDVRFASELSIFDGILSVVSILGFIVLGYQSCELRRTNEIASTSLDLSRLQQRAWVGVAEAQVAIRPNELADIRFRLANSGQTPARQLKSQIEAVVLSAAEPLRIEYPLDAPRDGTALAPNASTVIQDRKWLMRPDVIAALRSRQSVLWAHARVTYTDIYGNERLTTVCVEVTGEDLNPTFCRSYNTIE